MTDQDIIDIIAQGIVDGTDLDCTVNDQAREVLRQLRAAGVIEGAVKSSVRLTDKERFCLRVLANGPASTFRASDIAEDEGINRASCRYEWADAPFRSLRAKGLAVKTGRFDRLKRAIHEITDAGRAALEAPQ
jgi:DNA-binding MarR family transcriptional regulator